jgi:hypothetical protein
VSINVATRDAKAEAGFMIDQADRELLVAPILSIETRRFRVRPKPGVSEMNAHRTLPLARDYVFELVGDSGDTFPLENVSRIVIDIDLKNVVVARIQFEPI